MGQEDSTALTGIAHWISISTFFQLLRCANPFYLSLGNFIFNIVLPAIFITQLAYSCFPFSFVVEALSAKVISHRTGRSADRSTATGTPHCGRRPECDCRWPGPGAYSRTLLHEWYQASPAADASQSETRLLLWRHCWLNNTGLAIQCDMNSLTSVLNFESKNKMRRRSVEMFQVAIVACLSDMFSVPIKTNTFIANMKTPARGARTHNLPKSRQTRYLLRHIAAEDSVLKDDDYETPRGSLVYANCIPTYSLIQVRWWETGR